MGKRRRLSKKGLLLFGATMILAFLFSMTAMAASSKTVNMKRHSSGVYVYDGIASGTVYHKIKVTKPGILGVSGSRISANGITGKLRIWLCDSKKKSLEPTSSGRIATVSENISSEDIIYYGVKKGTYYIKVTNQPYYLVMAAFEAVADKGGASKAKATNIKMNRELAGVMPVGESASKADWFKFKVTKKKVLKLHLSSFGTGKFRFYLYGPSYKKGILVTTLMKQEGIYYSTNGKKVKTKVDPGTYYIKVVRGTGVHKKASGTYSISWTLQ